ncbi:hypothetical protein ACNKHV_13850 [Shigella flexneri]
MLNEQRRHYKLKISINTICGQVDPRFANPALKHKTWQIAMDGSQKVPQRMLAGIRIHLGRERTGRCWRWRAGWMRYVAALMMPEMP